MAWHRRKTAISQKKLAGIVVKQQSQQKNRWHRRKTAMSFCCIQNPFLASIDLKNKKTFFSRFNTTGIHFFAYLCCITKSSLASTDLKKKTIFGNKLCTLYSRSWDTATDVNDLAKWSPKSWSASVSRAFADANSLKSSSASYHYHRHHRDLLRTTSLVRYSAAGCIEVRRINHLRCHLFIIIFIIIKT